MDKVKQILEQLRKHHFWILCGIAALVGLAAWYLSSGKLQAEFTQNATRIDGELKKVDGISGDQAHDNWKEVADRQKAAVQQAVKSARDTIYRQQKAEVFTWPKELGDDFLESVAKIEGTSDGLSVELRERYLDWVKGSVRTLAKTVDSPMPDEAQTVPGGEYGAAAPEHKVSWPSITQIQQTFDWEQRPSTLLVKYAQEELWVYQTLCNIIAELNKSSQAHDAAVKDIISMDIAYLASDFLSKTATKGRIQPIAAASVAATPDPAAAASPPETTLKPNVSTRGKRDTSSEAAPSGDAAATPPPNPDAIWRTFRYVDEKGDPKTAAAEEKPEYYLMPFRLLLKMDRRSVDKLLLECRNSKLPIDVQQVRINPSASTTNVGMGGGGGGGGAGHSEADYGPGAGAGAAAGKQYDRYATVEVRGVVYLLQPEPLPTPEGAAPENATEGTPADNAGSDAPPATPAPAGNGE